jgi:hypothetical protein
MQWFMLYDAGSYQPPVTSGGLCKQQQWQAAPAAVFMLILAVSWQEK